MISTLPTGIVLLFVSCVALCFLLPYFKDRVNRQLHWPFQWGQWKPFACFLLPMVLLFAGGQVLALPASATLRFFAAASIIAFAVGQLNLPARLSSIILLCAGVLSSAYFAPQGGLPLIAMVGGLLLYKSTSNLYFQNESSFEDVLPALIWLSGSYWIQVVNNQTGAANMQGVLLAGLSVGMLMRLVQGPFMFDDKLYVKRLVLALSAGLFMLIILTKVLLLPNLTGYAVLSGAGFAYAYFFQPLDQPDGQLPDFSRMFSFLVVTGMLTLIACRLFGTAGLFVLAPVAMVSIGSNLAVYAALYWVGRGLIQAYTYQFNPNVTGINLTHAYANAALYAGMLLVIVVCVCLKSKQQRWLSAAAVLLFATGVPLVSNYILHEEPTGSLLLSAVMAAILMVAAYPVMFKEPIGQQGNLLLVPLQMAVFALLGNELIALGNAADSSLRITVLAVMAVLVCLAMIITAVKLKAGQTVSVSGN